MPGTEECLVSIRRMDGWSVRTLEIMKCWPMCAGDHHRCCAEGFSAPSRVGLLLSLTEGSPCFWPGWWYFVWEPLSEN